HGEAVDHHRICNVSRTGARLHGCLAGLLAAKHAGPGQQTKGRHRQANEELVAVSLLLANAARGIEEDQQLPESGFSSRTSGRSIHSAALATRGDRPDPKNYRSERVRCGNGSSWHPLPKRAAWPG